MNILALITNLNNIFIDNFLIFIIIYLKTFLFVFFPLYIFFVLFSNFYDNDKKS